MFLGLLRGIVKFALYFICFIVDLVVFVEYIFQHRASMYVHRCTMLKDVSLGCVERACLKDVSLGCVFRMCLEDMS